MNDNPRGSSSRAVVVLQEAAEPLAAADLGEGQGVGVGTSTARCFSTLLRECEQLVVLALVRPLDVVVLEKLALKMFSRAGRSSQLSWSTTSAVGAGSRTPTRAPTTSTMLQRAGIDVHYCAEQFENDGGPAVDDHQERQAGHGRRVQPRAVGQGVPRASAG